MKRSPREAGSVTVFFVLFALVMIGAISYSLYIGRVVDEKIKVDTAADIAALAMASHSAQGLNMIATNNLAIAANLHVAASVTFIGRYYALVRAFMVGISDIPEVIKLYLPGSDSTSFADGFKYTAWVNGHFTKTAAGLTTINTKIGKSWFYAAPLKGLEQARMNAPGAVMMPLQLNRLAAGDPAALYSFQLEHLGLTTALATMCHTIKSSEFMGSTRHAVSLWVPAVIESITGTTYVFDILRVVENLWTSVVGVIEKIKKAHSDMDDDCGLTNPLACIGAAALKPIANVLKDLPIPAFDGCGLSEDVSGNYGKQLEQFGKKEEEQNTIGFVVPRVDGANLKDYEDSLQFAAVVGKPLLIGEEINTDQCPQELKQVVNGREICSMVLGGIDFGTAGNHAGVQGLDAASGGLSLATGDNAGNAGGLRSVWRRTQWSVAQARVEYEPDIEGCGNGRAVSDCDPTYAAHLADDPVAQRDIIVSKRRMQLFWPAWRSRNAETTVMEAALSMLGN